MIKNKEIIRRIIQTVKRNKDFFITAHLRPDGDTIGSELALASWLKRLGKKVTVANVDPLPRIYHFLPGISLLRTSKKIENNFEVGFILECGDLERIGGIIDLKKQLKTAVNIDHHTATVPYANINWIDSKASATAEQIYYLLTFDGGKITPHEALYLYVGILTDTGKFQHSNTTSRTHQIVSHLLEYGINPEDVYQKVYATKSFPSLQLLGSVLNGLKIINKGTIAYQKITQKMYEKFGFPEDDEETINYPFYIPEVKVSILFRELPEKDKQIKVGFRSRNQVDVNRLAKHFGGGGHFHASACIIRGKLKEVEEKVINYTKKFV